MPGQWLGWLAAFFFAAGAVSLWAVTRIAKQHGSWQLGRKWLRAGPLLLVFLLCGPGLVVTSLLRTKLASQVNAVGQQAGSLAFQLVHGDQPRTVADYRGKVVVLNYWATW